MAECSLLHIELLIFLEASCNVWMLFFFLYALRPVSDNFLRL